jgi:hypothetical protein
MGEGEREFWMVKPLQRGRSPFDETGVERGADRFADQLEESRCRA